MKFIIEVSTRGISDPLALRYSFKVLITMLSILIQIVYSISETTTGSCNVNKSDPPLLMKKKYNIGMIDTALTGLILKKGVNRLLKKSENVLL